jgi:hypothetical protein
MKTVRIEVEGIELFCDITLNQEDNIDQGFELVNVTFRRENIKAVVDENMICELIYKEL